MLIEVYVIVIFAYKGVCMFLLYLLMEVYVIVIVKV